MSGRQNLHRVLTPEEREQLDTYQRRTLNPITENARRANVTASWLLLTMCGLLVGLGLNAESTDVATAAMCFLTACLFGMAAGACFRDAR